MLADNITLPIDVLNNGTTVDLTFDRYEELLNRSTYISSVHEPGKRDIVAFYRTLPKTAGTFKGVRKSTVKFTSDLTVADNAGGTIDCPFILELNFSIPIGVSNATIVAMRQRAIALLDQDTIMDKLNDLQMV